MPCSSEGNGSISVLLAVKDFQAASYARQLIKCHGHSSDSRSPTGAYQSVLACMQVDVEEVSGGLNLVFMGTSVTNAYHNLTNIILSISPKRALGQPAVLINAHFDSSFGSPGEPACCQRQPGCSEVAFIHPAAAQPAGIRHQSIAHGLGKYLRAGAINALMSGSNAEAGPCMELAAGGNPETFPGVKDARKPMSPAHASADPGVAAERRVHGCRGV